MIAAAPGHLSCGEENYHLDAKVRRGETLPEMDPKPQKAAAKEPKRGLSDLPGRLWGYSVDPVPAYCEKLDAAGECK
jgi:hypothetical protein